jgi:DNA polymerase epsilon subunit 1
MALISKKFGLKGLINLRCMVIPASREENKMLKKRYAVFNFNGKLAELKGFELKRRGELQIIKIFQGEVFDKFLCGKTLEECYKACAEIAQRWYDILESEGENIEEEELIEYIGETRVLSRPLADYGSQKSTAITCAKRIKQFLGDEIVKDKGLHVNFLISKKPFGSPKTERAVPTAIFSMDEKITKKFLYEWLKDFDSSKKMNIKSLIDWGYYKERLANAIQKIISIPAAIQNIGNPLPDIPIPEWLTKRIRNQNSKLEQKSISNFFKPAPSLVQPLLTSEHKEGITKSSEDIEDIDRLLESPSNQGLLKGTHESDSDNIFTLRPDADIKSHSQIHNATETEIKNVQPKQDKSLTFSEKKQQLNILIQQCPTHDHDFKRN